MSAFSFGAALAKSIKQAADIPNLDIPHARGLLGAHDSVYRNNEAALKAGKPGAKAWPDDQVARRALHLGTIRNPRQVNDIQRAFYDKYQGQRPVYAPPLAAPAAASTQQAAAPAPIQLPGQ